MVCDKLKPTRTLSLVSGLRIERDLNPFGYRDGHLRVSCLAQKEIMVLPKESWDLNPQSHWRQPAIKYAYS